MAALKDKLVNLGGLDYFNRNVALPHQNTISTMAQALALMQQWANETESRIETLENTSNGSFASMFEIALPDVMHISSDGDAVSAIETELNIDGFSQVIGTSGIRWKKPTIVLPEIEWSHTVDSNYDHTATANVRIVFGKAGAVVKTITLKKPGEGKIRAVKGSNTSVYVDTGIAADYSYTFHAKGFAETSTTVLIGAYVSNAARTTLRMLPASGAAQQMWANNQQYSSAQLGGITVTSMFEYWQKANYLRVVQGDIDATITPSGNTSSGSVGANIFLFNEDANSSRGYGTLSFAEVLQGDTQIAYFAPYELHTGEIVIVNTAGITAQQILDIVRNGDSAEMASRILRPTNGELVDAT